jgi:tRNA(adenine34) deaminase
MAKQLCHCSSGFNRRQASATLVFAGLAGLAPPMTWAWARVTQTGPRPDDERFMRLALAEAARGDFPFGAVITKGDRVLSSGHNSGKTMNDPTAHGEMMAIHHFVAERPASELQGATLYTTGEPCPMCMGAIIWCGISRVVFAASIDELATRIGQIMVTSRFLAEAAPFANVETTGGVLSNEALALFSQR